MNGCLLRNPLQTDFDLHTALYLCLLTVTSHKKGDLYLWLLPLVQRLPRHRCAFEEALPHIHSHNHLAAFRRSNTKPSVTVQETSGRRAPLNFRDVPPRPCIRHAYGATVVPPCSFPSATNIARALGASPDRSPSATGAAARSHDRTFLPGLQ